MLPPGLTLPPQGSTQSMSQSFQPNTMISQPSRPGLVQPLGATQQLTTVLPPTQSVIQLQQLPQLQFVVPSGQPTTTHILNAGPPPMMQRHTIDPNDPMAKVFTSSCVEATVYGPPPSLASSTVQTYYSQYVPCTTTAVSPAPVITSSSAAVGHNASYSRESSHHKRRFKEEKDGDQMPDNLLGYQVGCG